MSSDGLQRRHQHRQHAHERVVEIRRQWKNASAFTLGGWSDRRMRRISLGRSGLDPFAQRFCCDLNAFISTGSSAGAT